MKRKNETFSQAIVGLFMIAVILLLGYFTIVISGVDVLSGRNRVPIRIAFDHVGGLKDRDNVMYRGTKVGVIDRVEVTTSNLVVVARVDDQIVMRTGYRASVCNLSMLGGYYLKLEEGVGEVLPLAGTEFVGTPPTDWMEDVSKIARNINELTSNPQLQVAITNFAATAERARAIAEHADEVMARIQRGEGTVGRLLSKDDSVYRDISETASGAKEMVASATKAFENVAQISEGLKDEKTLADLRGGIAAFRKAAESFDAKELTAKANVLADNLNAVAVKLKTGEGTLGRLANDPEMYNELNGLIKDCRQIIDNFRDTTPITTFSSLATGAL